MKRCYSALEGMTFIDVIVGTSVMLIVFLGIFGAFKLSIQLVFTMKAKAGAIALLTDQLEYIRGLPYESVGTVGGIPTGSIPQLQQKSLNSITYTRKTLVQYVDNPSDGLGIADSNGITADYKSVKVETFWMVRGESRSAFAVTYISPHSIESLASGGTIRINVFDAIAEPVPSANVRVVNASVSPVIDVTVATNGSGVIEFPGTPPASNYQILVSKPGYSSAQTYSISGAIPNPTPGNLSVVNGQTSTASFAIDKTGSLAISTLNPPGPGNFADTFTNQSKLFSTTSATTSGGALRLDGSAGSYPVSGSGTSVSIAPLYLSGWTALSFTASTSPQTSVAVHLYYWNGSVYALIPNADLAGNSVGFTASPIDLSALPAATYTDLRLGVTIASSDPLWTPEILEWSISYVAGPTPLPNVPFLVRGTKTIGMTGGGLPVYKLTENDTTDAAGVRTIDPIEWDTYFISLPSGSSYAISEQCPSTVAVDPAQSVSASLTLVPAPGNSLRVIVSGMGGAISGATVAISGPTNASMLTSACGQSFFSGIPASDVYTVTVTTPGYQTHTDTHISVAGQSILPVSLDTTTQ
jgi:hypothetical protein